MPEHVLRNGKGYAFLSGQNHLLDMVAECCNEDKQNPKLVLPTIRHYLDFQSLT